MKFKQFKFIIPFFVILFLTSCLDTADVATYSVNPTFVSLVFAANDSIPDIDDAVFSLEWDDQLNDSVIVNLDSLPYQTRIDSVNPTFSFRSTGRQVLYKFDGDSVVLTGTDTIDFSEIEKIKNSAEDLVHPRTYPIKVNVHLVEPELYVWNKVTGNINNQNAIHQKAVYFKGTAFYYSNDNATNYVSVSADGYNWSSETISGLPLNCSFSDLTVSGSMLYVTVGDKNIYSSSDGLTWTAKTQFEDYKFSSLICTLNNKIWAVAQSTINSKYYIVNNINGDFNDANVLNEIESNFPISDFTALSFKSRTGKDKVIVVGGKDISGNTLLTNWNSENGTYWVNFSEENKTLDTLSMGASIILYDDKLFLFGVRNDNPTLMSHYKVSIDEGFSWQTPDTTYNMIPNGYVVRNNTNAIVFNPMVYDDSETYTVAQMTNSNRIILLGGKTNDQNLSDVWTVKLNRKSFLQQ